MLRRIIRSLTRSFTTRRSCWISTRKTISRKSCCRAFDLLGRIKKSCVVEYTANLTSFSRWARFFVVFVAQAVCTEIVLADKVVSITWWAQLILRACGTAVFLFALLIRSFCAKSFVRNVLWGWRLFLLRRNVPMFSTVFRWCLVDWHWEVAIDKLGGLRTDGSLIAFSTHFVIGLSLEL